MKFFQDSDARHTVVDMSRQQDHGEPSDRTFGQTDCRSKLTREPVKDLAHLILMEYLSIIYSGFLPPDGDCLINIPHNR